MDEFLQGFEKKLKKSGAKIGSKFKRGNCIYVEVYRPGDLDLSTYLKVDFDKKEITDNIDPVDEFGSVRAMNAYKI